MTDESRNQLLCLAATLFAVRLFKGSDKSSKFYLGPNRDQVAECCALDAAAIIAAVDKIADATP